MTWRKENRVQYTGLGLIRSIRMRRRNNIELTYNKAKARFFANQRENKTKSISSLGLRLTDKPKFLLIQHQRRTEVSIEPLQHSQCTSIHIHTIHTVIIESKNPQQTLRRVFTISE